MKILSNKEAETLFDCIMTMYLVGGDSVRQQAMREETDMKTILRRNRILTEQMMDAAHILKGMFGMQLAMKIQEQVSAERLKRLEEEQAKKDKLDELCVK